MWIMAQDGGQNHIDFLTPQRASGREQRDPERRGQSLAEPDRDPHHQAKGRERSKPSQPDIGFPAGRAGDQRKLRSAEMPQVIICEAPRRARFPKHWD
jgi:hypothetical protein